MQIHIPDNLPESVSAIIGLIGLPAAIAFIRTFGGIKIYTPNNHQKQQALFAEVIGDRLASLICMAHVGRGAWHVPKCAALLNSIRNQRIRDDYATGELTINDLAIKYRLGHSMVSRILKQGAP